MPEKKPPGNNNKPIWKVYMLQCADGSYYTGITNNLDARIEKHNSGKASKYTRSRLPVTMVYAETVTDKSQALKKEFALNKLRREEKQKFIVENSIK